jgi:hypothetical protein
MPDGLAKDFLVGFTPGYPSSEARSLLLDRNQGLVRFCTCKVLCMGPGVCDCTGSLCVQRSLAILVQRQHGCVGSVSDGLGALSQRERAGGEGHRRQAQGTLTLTLSQRERG